MSLCAQNCLSSYISVEHLNIDLLTCTDGEQQNQYHRLNPRFLRTAVCFSFFFIGARLCVCGGGGCFVWFVHDGLSSTLLNGMGHETKLRHATCLRGIQPEFKALLLIMILIKRLFDVIGWSMSIEKKQEREK